MKVLIVGGYGTFGGRIVELLENQPRLTLIIAGRSLAKANAYCGSRHGAEARLVPAQFDRDGDLAAQLASLRPDTMVDASGPFQAYGEGRYRVIEACIAQGVNYLDLADGSDFVAGVSAFDAAARETGLFVLSGVSSFPVLTAAAVRRLSLDMARVETIRGGIAPSPFAGVGENVIRAIAGYAGQPVQLARDGEPSQGHPFTEQMRYTIAPPGRLPLRSTLFSLVDVPDLRALADLWPQAQTIWMGAGPVPEVLHRALIGLAWLVRAGLVRSLLPLASLMHWASNRLRWGEHRGGMFVAVEGADRSRTPVRRSWHLLAEGNDGPLIRRWRSRRWCARRWTDICLRQERGRPCATWNSRTMKHCLPTGRSIPASGTIPPMRTSRSTPPCSATPGKTCPRRSAPCTMARPRRRDAPASSAEAICLAGLQPGWSGFRRPVTTSRSMSASTPTKTKKPGRGHSAGRVSPAASSPDAADPSGCCANASAR
ncbi:MAG: hypothetical protein EOS86_15075 [Mesorhizobium sp.]|nr:MAG: hypothetical protein EOS86_15075 [Mesorhizobium sp.]